MSFAIQAVSKKLQAIGLSHLITEGGHIIVEAYDPNALVADLISVKKEGKTWIIKRSPKKKVKAREYYKKLMRAKRASGQYKPKKTGKKYPKRAAAIKKAHKNPKLFKREEGAKKKAAPKKAGKPAAKKVAVKKSAKKPAGKKRMV